jgi:hypothetical protein
MADSPPDDAAYRGALYTLESDQRAVVPGPPFWARGLHRLIWIIGLAALVAFMATWVVRVQASLARLESGLAMGSANQTGGMPGPSPEVRTLEARLARVLSASVETKLRRLEHSVERGTLGGEDLQLLEAAAGELRLLRTQPPGAGALEAAAEHPRYQSVSSPRGAGDGRDALGQISDLRTFVYILVVCLALFLLIALGLWYNTARQVRMIAATPRRQLPAMQASRESQRGG